MRKNIAKAHRIPPDFVGMSDAKSAGEPCAGLPDDL
jgi:hypothetical protein